MRRLFNRGFTLVELLVSMAAMGVIISTIYGLYLSTQKTAASQEEVVELQQNLRIAMDQVARDIRLAGFLVSMNNTPIQSAPNNPDITDTFVINMACPSGRSAYLDQDLHVENSSEATFRLARAEMVDLFDAEDLVRIVRPPSQSQPIAKLLHVTGTNRTARTVTVDGFDQLVDSAQYKAGDALFISSSTFPGSVFFYLHENEIFKKLSDGNTQRVTAKRMRGSALLNGITEFALEYLMDDGSARDTVTAAELGEVRAVRILLKGRAQVHDRAILRSLSSVVSLRNRQGGEI